MSPTVFREGPFRFFCFSREENGLHIHVQSADGEAKFGLSLRSSWRETTGSVGRTSAGSSNSSNDASRRFEMPGAATSEAEVTNISAHGFWLLLDGRELFLPFDEFPWFKRAPVEAILRLQRPQPGHLYWPELDVDLAVDSIEHPERYPLKAQT